MPNKTPRRVSRSPVSCSLPQPKRTGPMGLEPESVRLVNWEA